VWYCHHRDGSLKAIVCEVRNTFGGMHHYVLSADGAPMDWRAEYRARKVFHVSPFIQPEAEYRFHFLQPQERLNVFIDAHVAGESLLKAGISGLRMPLTDTKLIYMFGRLPFMTLKIMLMIHWQAIKIWLRGGRFHRMPENGLYKDASKAS
jgi:DUF1365 family protein